MTDATQDDVGAHAQASADAVTDDDWAAALAEDTRNAPQARPATEQVFPAVDSGPPPTQDDGAIAGMERINNIPVQLTVELGRTRITIKRLLALSQGSTVELDGLAGEPLDIKVNGYPIAQGQVVQIGDSNKYGIRVTDIILPSERIQKLARP
ncbi:MAG TPA: flagellar motor switch protein FliN [Ramlibacter sp.]|nr:flagellar motor switch protein FliN [Ramlibacter sp.]